MLIDVSTMSHTHKFDLVTVGHFAMDTILTPKMKHAKTTLGGPPTYVSLAAAKLGVRVSVISKVGDDFQNQYITRLQNTGVDLSGLKQVSNASTTRYMIEYNKNWERKMCLEAQAPPISPSDLPRLLKSEILHVAPIANEISNAVVARLRKSAKVLSLDPQGFLRSFNKKGGVVLKRWCDPEVLAHAEVFKSAVDEVQAMMGFRNLRSAMNLISDYGVKIVIVTRGMKGAMLLLDGRFYDIPACKSSVVVDPTGAGDAYIGAFLAEYVRGKDALWCASVGSAAASFVVERAGPQRFGERHEVYERAQGIYEKTVEMK